MFFIVGLIALALAIAAIFGPQLHPVLMVFAFPVIATVYGGLTLIVCNLISSWLGWPELSLPWWPQRPGRAAVTAKGIRSAYVFVNERGQPFGRMGIARMVERGGEIANLPFPVHVHMLRHSTRYALAAKGMDTRRLQHFLGHASITNTVRYTAMSPEPFKDVWR